jgi:hypothetical protein
MCGSRFMATGKSALVGPGHRSDALFPVLQRVQDCPTPGIDLGRVAHF